MTPKEYEALMQDFWTKKYIKHKGRERHVVGRLDAPLEEYLRETSDIKETLKSVVETGKTVIDYGCGIGRFRDFLKIYFENYIGVDLVCKLKDEKEFIKAEDFMRADIKADAVFTSVVIQHITDDEYVVKLFKKFRECINKGGHLYMNEQTGNGSLLIRRGFPYIRRRSGTWYRDNVSAQGFEVENVIPRNNHWIFKFKRV